MEVAFLALEVCLLLMIYFEPPGWLNDEGHVKTVSEGLGSHPGFGGALFVCLMVEVVSLLQSSSNALLTSVLAWACLASVLGVIMYPPVFRTQHFIFAAGFFISSLLLSYLRWLENKTSFQVVFFLSASFALVMASFYVWPSAVGPLEVVYLYFMLGSWAPVRPPADNLTSPLWV
jgi:hypothetical protein